MTLEQAARIGSGGVYRYGAFDELRIHKHNDDLVFVQTEVDGETIFITEHISNEERLREDWSPLVEYFH
jgi:hypothetical protein